MGDGWWLRCGGVEVDWGKNDVPTKLMTIFQESDKYLDQRWLDAEAIVSAAEKGDANAFDDDDPALTDAYAYVESVDWRNVFGYRSTVGTVVERLALMGFTAERCRHEMISTLRAVNDDQDPIEVGLRAPAPDRSGFTRGAITGYSLVPCDQVVDLGLKALVAVQNKPMGSASEPDGMTPLERGCLDEIQVFLEDGEDSRVWLAVLLATRDPADVVQLDLHELLLAEYFTIDEPVTRLALEHLAEETASSGPIIVLTEGSTDARLLQLALPLVCPAVAGYFRFLDFEMKAPGGADQVVRSLRSFAAAGVMNRVVGLLDNDTAGRHAEMQLSETPLPSNFRYCRLPDIDYATAYPTLGPGGASAHDVNGRACSIEFYFGLDCLRSPAGSLVPVRWTSFNSRVDDYQGELVEKHEIQSRIEDMLAGTHDDVDPRDPRWAGIRAVAATLIEAARPAKSRTSHPAG